MNTKFEEFYARFEDRFRGNREDIKSRQSVYLKLLNILDRSGRGDEVLDIGCGRGEWLELLKEEGWRAYGRDLNDVMVDRCQKMGLNVQYGDAIQHMRELNDNSLLCISGFHIAEHLPFNVLLELFAEAFRILKPGGLLILETPNPENLQVAAHTFYLDPTHLRPLSPVLMNFMAADTGFGFADTLRLHPCPELAFAYLNKHTELERNIANGLYSARDYSIIAVKTDSVPDDYILKIKEEIMLINQKSLSTPISISEIINNTESRLLETELLLLNTQEQLNSILNSYSWKISAPLRFGLDFFKKVLSIKK
jgi:O-antigen chain-terminating methyltransferase